eukprot:gene10224-18908_t
MEPNEFSNTLHGNYKQNHEKQENSNAKLIYLKRSPHWEIVPKDNLDDNATSCLKSELLVSLKKPVHFQQNIESKNTKTTYNEKPQQEFPSDQIAEIANEILKNRLQNVEYDEMKCKELSKDLSNEIQNKIRKLNLPQYKLLCYVHLAEVRGQGMTAASRCMWDTNTGDFAIAKYESKSLSATASIFGSLA